MAARAVLREELAPAGHRPVDGAAIAASVPSLSSSLSALRGAFACGGSVESEPLGAPVAAAPPPAIDAKIASASLGSGYATVQIAFFAERATSPVAIEVKSVVLVDASTGSAVATLTAQAPGVWNGQTYEPWNGSVTPGGDLRASYPLSAPDWSTLDGTAKGQRLSSYSATYKLRLTILVGGAEVILESGQVQREADVQT